MYTVETIDNYEDWYVADGIIGKYKSIYDAVRVFCDELKNIRTDDDYAAGLKEYISEYVDTEEALDDYFGGGVTISINKDSQTIITKHFSYNHQFRSFIENKEIEVELKTLTLEERKAIEHLFRASLI